MIKFLSDFLKMNFTNDVSLLKKIIKRKNKALELAYEELETLRKQVAVLASRVQMPNDQSNQVIQRTYTHEAVFVVNTQKKRGRPKKDSSLVTKEKENSKKQISVDRSKFDENGTPLLPIGLANKK